MANKQERKKLRKLWAERDRLRKEPRTPKGNLKKATKTALDEVQGKADAILSEVRRKYGKKVAAAEKKKEKAQRSAEYHARMDPIKNKNKTFKSASDTFLDKLEEITGQRKMPTNARFKTLSPGDQQRIYLAIDEYTSATQAQGGSNRFGIGRRGGRFQKTKTGANPGSKNYVDRWGRVR